MKILTKIKNLRLSIIILSSFAFIFNPIAARASEADFLKGIMGAIIVNGIIQEVKKDNQPVIVRKQVTYVTPHSTQNSYQLPRKNKNVLYDTIPQRAFKSQTPSIRYNIQGELMKMGYYNGRLDGYWGYKTEHAISSYALDSNKLHLLTSVKGVNNLFKDLLYINPNHQNQQFNSHSDNDSKNEEILYLQLQITKLLKEVGSLENRLMQLKQEK